MGLLELPVELRIEILEYLDELSYGRHETIGPNVRLTPAICRANRTLRQDALPLYAKTSFFIIQTDDDLDFANSRVQAWLQAMGDTALKQVENIQLSRHWKIKQPSRWQGHVGFYIRLQQCDNVWQCTTGTYPIANDIRGMRVESIDLLRSVILRRLNPPAAAKERIGFTKSDVDFIVNAIDVVASHPISLFDTEQSEAGKQRRRMTWYSMEQKLLALDSPSSEQSGPPHRTDTFYTPY